MDTMDAMNDNINDISAFIKKHKEEQKRKIDFRKDHITSISSFDLNNWWENFETYTVGDKGIQWQYIVKIDRKRDYIIRRTRPATLQWVIKEIQNVFIHGLSDKYKILEAIPIEYEVRVTMKWLKSVFGFLYTLLDTFKDQDDNDVYKSETKYTYIYSVYKQRLRRYESILLESVTKDVTIVVLRHDFFHHLLSIDATSMNFEYFGLKRSKSIEQDASDTSVNNKQEQKQNHVSAPIQDPNTTISPTITELKTKVNHLFSDSNTQSKYPVQVQLGKFLRGGHRDATFMGTFTVLTNRDIGERQDDRRPSASPQQVIIKLVWHPDYEVSAITDEWWYLRKFQGKKKNQSDALALFAGSYDSPDGMRFKTIDLGGEFRFVHILVLRKYNGTDLERVGNMTKLYHLCKPYLTTKVWESWTPLDLWKYATRSILNQTRELFHVKKHLHGDLKPSNIVYHIKKSLSSSSSPSWEDVLTFHIIDYETVTSFSAAAFRGSPAFYNATRSLMKMTEKLRWEYMENDLSTEFYNMMEADERNQERVDFPGFLHTRNDYDMFYLMCSSNLAYTFQSHIVCYNIDIEAIG